MKRLLLSFALFALPLTVCAKDAHVYEEWRFTSGADIDEWQTVGLDQVELMNDGIQFAVHGQAALYRPLPAGFRNTDALRIHLQGKGLDDVSLLFLILDDKGGIARRTKLTLGVQEEGGSEYIPLDFYPSDLYRGEVLALSLQGNADDVLFGGVEFIRYSAWERLGALWKSFWSPEDFTGHTVNLLIGPAVTTDAGPFDQVFQWHTHATSVNAYFLAFLALSGIVLLFYGFVQRSLGRPWEEVRMMILSRFFLLIAAVWILYDYRMGWEFVRNVAHDHVTYIAASPETRTFRDEGRFYDFADAINTYAADREGYEVFLPDLWPYYGALRYLTYPLKPNKDEPFYDTWAIFDRSDVIVQDGRLVLLGEGGEPFTREGTVLDQFDDHSFIFRENPPQ